MLRAFVAWCTAIAVMLSPCLVSAQDCLMTGSQSSATSAGGDAATTNAESTAQFVVSPFVATESGLASSSEWTTAALAAAATQVGYIMLFVLIALAVLVALGWGIYLTVKALAADETAFRRFLRYNRQALKQQVVAGHGPVLVDFGAMFAVSSSYTAFAAAMRQRQSWLRSHLSAEAVEGPDLERVSREIVWSLLGERAVVEEWLATNRLAVTLAPL